MIIAVDFDGTCVAHEYPEIGRDIGAVPVLKDLVAQGHQLILFTMRGGECLLKAVQWFNDNDIELYGVNTNPTQSEWTDSPKAYAELYIDDAGFCAPVIWTEGDKRPHICWSVVRKTFEQLGVL